MRGMVLNLYAEAIGTYYIFLGEADGEILSGYDRGLAE